MDTVVYIRGPAEGLDELAAQLKECGVKCSRALDLQGRGGPPGAADVTLGITGNATTITVAVMTFLATHRKKWRLRAGDGTDVMDNTCQQLESLLVRTRLVLKRISPDETTTFRRSGV